MYMEGDKILNEYFKSDPSAKKEWQKFKKLRSFDPRVTRIGKIIRQYSIDELPQLLNVLQGKMSLVGPRPYLSHELKGKEISKKTITKVKPGITGLWQIITPGDRPLHEDLEYDFYYIKNYSIWMDLSILLQTIPIILFGKKSS